MLPRIALLLLIATGQVRANDAPTILTDTLWQVTSIERDGQPSTDFQITESTNGGPKTTLPLQVLTFKRRSMTLEVGAKGNPSKHSLQMTTGRIPNTKEGQFRATLLGQPQTVDFRIEGKKLTLTMKASDKPEMGLVITAEAHP